MSHDLLFEGVGLVKQFPSAGAPRGLNGASFAIPAEDSVALVGASGAGKTTLALCVAGHETPSQGRMSWRGEPVWPGRAWQPRRAIQLVRQDSPLALHPNWRVRELLDEPLLLAQPREPADMRRASVERWANHAGLAARLLDRTAGEISGGQRQRVAMARALAVTELELLILDEPFSGLDDASAQTLTALVLNEQRARGFSLLYITHDLDQVGRLATTVAVMDAGAVVETAPAAQWFAAPAHPASRLLIGSRL
ncbi:MAG: ATP-binding cassette domain-containing protein [Bryobacterales bacterium]|nr:ATP-binding cassette domain-containing protein [Bryobacterales bacterium]